MKKKKENIFNLAFKNLESLVKEKRSKKVMKSPQVKKHEIIESVPDEDICFLDAMSDVIPLSEDRKQKIRSQGKNIWPSHTLTDDEEEAMAHLRDLVKGSVEMDITFSDEYIEGAIIGVPRNIMRRLKRGQLPVQDYIDLHGLTKKDAETRVREFLLKSYSRGLRCVLIVHGRGLNSPDSIPILKERLPVWLNRGPARKIVLAFATARPYDGGAGAIYVLLRKRS